MTEVGEIERCPNCGEETVRRREIKNGDWLSDPIEIEYVHEEEQIGEGNGPVRILDSCRVEP